MLLNCLIVVMIEDEDPRISGHLLVPIGEHSPNLGCVFCLQLLTKS